jgi:hypothetical protein
VAALPAEVQGERRRRPRGRGGRDRTRCSPERSRARARTTRLAHRSARERARVDWTAPPRARLEQLPILSGERHRAVCSFSAASSSSLRAANASMASRSRRTSASFSRREQALELLQRFPRWRAGGCERSSSWESHSTLIDHALRDQLRVELQAAGLDALTQTVPPWPDRWWLCPVARARPRPRWTRGPRESTCSNRRSRWWAAFVEH